MTEQDDQTRVASLLASTPPPEVSADFLSRVNARIDGTDGWFGVADFRLWTLRLAPAAAVLALITVLWPATSTDTTTTTTTTTTTPSVSTVAADTFRPGSQGDWQQEVSSDALLVAALTGAGHAR
jgi:hypothetical protein